jgi:hypothetical protein
MSRLNKKLASLKTRLAQTTDPEQREFYRFLISEVEESLRYKRSQATGTTAEVIATIAFGVLGVLGVIGLIIAISFIGGQSEEDKQYYRNLEMRDKADAMRRQGFDGSDEQLARNADLLKKWNEEAKRQAKQDREYLGY